MQISNVNFEVTINEATQSSRIALLLVMLMIASASLLWYQRKILERRWKQSIKFNLPLPVSGIFFVVGVLMLGVACAPPQSDSTSSTFDYTGSYDRVHSVWKWDDTNSKWLAYSPKTSVAAELVTQGYSTFAFVEKGKGYWVRLSTSGVPTSLSFAEPPAF